MLKKRTIIAIMLVVSILSTSTLSFFCLWWSQYNQKPDPFEEFYNLKLAQFEVENNFFKQYGIAVDVAFIGDSITQGFEQDKSYYETDYVVAWRGIGGDNTFTMHKRLKVSLYDVTPKLVVMCIGGNNIYTMFDNYDEILSDLKTNLPDTKVIVHSIYPTALDYADRNDVIPQLNVRLMELVEGFGYIYVDTHSAVKDERGEFDLAYTDDGIHPNQAGYQKIAQVLVPAINDAMANA